MHSSQWKLQFNQHGAVTQLIQPTDPQQMNWVIDPDYLEQVGYSDADKLFGEFDVTINGHQYRSVNFKPQIEIQSEQTIITFRLAEVTIRLTYKICDDKVLWYITMNNETSQPLVINDFGVWCSLAYVMFRDKNVGRNMHQSAAVFPSISPSFTKLAAVRRDNSGHNLGLFQTGGVVQSVGTACEWTNLFFENVSPSLDGMLFHKLVLAGGYKDEQIPKNDWIYPHTNIELSDELEWSFVLTPFNDQANFAAVAAQLNHPIIDFPPMTTQGEKSVVTIAVPGDDSIKQILLRSQYHNQPVSVDITTALGNEELEIKPTKLGEHELLVRLQSGKEDRVVFNVMAPVRRLIQQRVQWLSEHSFEGPSGNDPYAFGPVSNQGESLGKLSLILMSNLLSPTENSKRQIREVEQSAVHYVRNKWFINGDFKRPMPLYGDFYRVMDFEYIGHVYYRLSKFSDDTLQLNSATEYLHWAAAVFNLRVNPSLHKSQRAKEESQMLGVYFLYIDDLLNDLKTHGLKEDYQTIKQCWDNAVSRVATDSSTYKAAITEHFYDNAGFGPATGALANAGYISEAKRYAELLKANIGFSNDFRSQAPDRWWEALSYMIHALWGGITAASSLLAYEKIGDHELLEASYRAFVGVLYMYDTNATTPDRKLEPGEAASTYSIAGPNINRPDLSRNRFGQSAFASDGGIFTKLFPDGDTGHDDWDMGEELAAYLMGFGQKTYVYTDDDGTVSVVNGQIVRINDNQYEITSLAPYPKVFMDAEHQHSLETTDTTVLYSVEKGFERK